MKKLSIITLMLAAMFTACSKKEKKVTLINNMLLYQLSDDKGYNLGQQMTETFLSRLIEEDVVNAQWNDLTIFVKTLNAARDTNYYSVRMKNDPDKPSVVVSLTDTRFNDLVSKECAECTTVKVSQDAATKAWTVSAPAKK